MNGKQAAREAAKRIEELEFFNRSAAAAIRSLYQAIEGIFNGENVCLMCEDYEECQLEAKEGGKGCALWTHKSIPPEELPPLEIGTTEGLTGGVDES